MFAEAPEDAPVIQGRDLKQELAVEGGGGYAPPAPTAQPYYPPPQPYYPPPQQYYPPAPQPQYYPPQQYAPTPVPAPYSDPNMGSPSIDYYADDPTPPDESQSYSQNNHVWRLKKTTQRHFSAIQLLPLGLNLFLDDQMLAGISLAAQATTLGLWYMAFNDEQTTYESASQTIEQASEDPEYSTEDIEKFRQITDEYLAQKQTEQLIYLSLFGASWLASSVYAYFTSAKAIKGKRYRSKKSYYGMLESKPSQIVPHKPKKDTFQLETFSPDFKSLALRFEMNL